MAEFNSAISRGKFSGVPLELPKLPRVIKHRHESIQEDDDEYHRERLSKRARMTSKVKNPLLNNTIEKRKAQTKNREIQYLEGKMVGSLQPSIS